MSRFKCLVTGKELENVEEDFRTAQKVEQYRIGKKALYLPEGLHWNYIPLESIIESKESFRVISAGHCVAVREKRPEIDLETEIGTIHLQLEKEKSLKTVLDAL